MFRFFLLMALSLSLFGDFYKDYYDDYDIHDLIKRHQSTYLLEKFRNKIDRKSVKNVVIIGLYSGLDTIALRQYFDATVYAFEADPRRFNVLEDRFNHFDGINLIKKACSDVTGKIDFYQAAFPGASSIYKFNLDLMADWSGKTKEDLLRYERGECYQRKVEVDSIRLDEWMETSDIQKIDFLGMDVQGATYQVLVGLGDRIKDVHYLICEGEFKEIYEGEVLWPQIVSYLESKGFYPAYHINYKSGYFGDLLFINSNYSRD